MHEEKHPGLTRAAFTFIGNIGFNIYKGVRGEKNRAIVDKSAIGIIENIAIF